MDIQMGAMVVQGYKLEWTPVRIQRLADPDSRRYVLKTTAADGRMRRLERWLEQLQTRHW